MFTQMTKANKQSCNKFDSSMIFTIKNTTGGWSDKFLDIVFESTKTSDISNVIVKTVSLNNSWRKKQIFEKVTFLFKEGYVFSISSGVNVLKELTWKAAEENHVCKFWKSSIAFRNSDRVEGTLNVAHRKAFLLMYFLFHRWLPGTRYIGQILFCGEKMNYKLFHI